MIKRSPILVGEGLHRLGIDQDTTTWYIRQVRDSPNDTTDRSGCSNVWFVTGMVRRFGCVVTCASIFSWRWRNRFRSNRLRLGLVADGGEICRSTICCEFVSIILHLHTHYWTTISATTSLASLVWRYVGDVAGDFGDPCARPKPDRIHRNCGTLWREVDHSLVLCLRTKYDKYDMINDS